MNPRARRIALITASVPELTRRTCSSEGSAEVSSSAISSSSAVGAPKVRPRAAVAVHRGEHAGIRVPEDERTPGAHVVDVLAPVLVDEARTAPLAEEHRRAAHGAEGAHGGVDPAGNQFLRTFKEAAAALVHRAIPGRWVSKRRAKSCAAARDVARLEERADDRHHVGAGGDRERRIRRA